MTLVAVAVTGLFFGMSYAFADYTATKADLLLHGKSYAAHVIDFEEIEFRSDAGDRVTNHYPIVELMTDDGETLTRTLPDSDMEYEHRVGGTRTVYYHAGEDDITAFGGMTVVALGGMPILFTALGLGVLRVGALCLWGPDEALYGDDPEYAAQGIGPFHDSLFRRAVDLRVALWRHVTIMVGQAAAHFLHRGAHARDIGLLSAVGRKTQAAERENNHNAL
ncbi:MAG: DUF3592 domain-containing protein [Rikenellaceae bacterium]|jgi:hypothetical protein|nr:DUF3592 domain-containing protein [Rikenellaceae bacterium]